MHPRHYVGRIKALQAPRVISREITNDSIMFALRDHITATLYADHEAPVGHDEATISVKVNRRIVATFHLHRMDENGFNLVSAYLAGMREIF